MTNSIFYLNTNNSVIKTTNHRLHIEIRRWPNILHSERFCNFCNMRQIGDKFHILLKCEYVSDKRCLLFDKQFCTPANILKFRDLMKVRQQPTLKKLPVYKLSY